MPVTVNFVEKSDRCIHVEYSPPLDISTDILEALEKANHMLETVKVFPAALYIDVRKLTDLTFSDVMVSLGTLAQSEQAKKQLMFEVHTIYIGSGELVNLIVEALRQKQYGGLTKVTVAKSIEEAALLFDAKLTGV